MAKKIAFILALITFMLISGCAENKATTFNPKYAGLLVPMYNTATDNDQNMPKGISPSNEQQKDISKLFTSICEHFNIKKAVPKFELLTSKQFESYAGNKMLKACYDFQTKTVYLSETLDLNNIEDKEVFTHETLHYLSDNGDKRGFIYFNDGKEYNRGFNEGATEFFATEFVGKNIDGPYEFQEALVEQLSMCLGYNTVKDAYFYSEDSIIRAAFNDMSDIYPRKITEDGVEYDTYDTFACTCFTMWAYGTLNDFQTECATFTALEEQLLYLASKTGNTEECKKSLEKFLKDFGVDDSTLQALFDIKYLRSI